MPKRADFGRITSQNVMFHILTDSTNYVDPDKTKEIYAGSPVTLKKLLDNTVVVTTISTPVKPYGIALVHRNNFLDETIQGFAGEFGGGRMSVLVKGMVSFRRLVFQDAQNNEVIVTMWEDDVNNADPMTPLYVSANGKLTTDGTGREITKIGYIVKAPSSHEDELVAIIDN